MSKIPEWAVATGHEIAAQQWLHTFEKADLAKTIALAISEAYTRGQMDMRERAAQLGDKATKLVGNDQWAKGYHLAGADIALSIRSLPLQDEEGK